MRQQKQKELEDCGSMESLELESQSMSENSLSLLLDQALTSLNHKVNGLMDMMVNL